MLTVIGAFLLIPLLMWQEASQRFRMLPPLEQNLTRVWGQRDGMLTGRAWLRSGFGAAGAWYLRDVPGWRTPAHEFWSLQLCTVLFVVSWWLLLTGAVRFVLMSAGGGVSEIKKCVLTNLY